MISILIVALTSLCILFVVTGKYRAQQMLKKYVYEPLNTPSSLGCSFDSDKIKLGLDYYKTKNVIIAGLIRDSADSIDIMKKNVAKFASIFASYKVLVIENDSKDDTREILLEWAKSNPNITVLGCGINADTCELNLPPASYKTKNEKRIRKMVLLRNIYMDYIAQNSSLFTNFDFLVAIDFDIKGTFYLDGIGSSGYNFMSKKELDGICANGLGLSDMIVGVYKRYHDPYAHKEIGEIGSDSLFNVGNFWQIPNCDHGDPKKLRSCFNGLTIYRLSSIINKKYTYDIERGETLCEHVTFNSQMNNIYIDPGLIFVVLSNK